VVTRPLRLTVPAESAWVLLVRTAATSVCARLDYDVERLEDVRLAVDEVAGILVADAEPGSDLDCTLQADDDGRLVVTLCANTVTPSLPSPDSFAWAVLTALVDDVAVHVEGPSVTVVLHTSRQVAPTHGATLDVTGGPA